MARQPERYGGTAASGSSVSAQDTTRTHGQPALAMAGNITTLSSTITSGLRRPSSCCKGFSASMAVSMMASQAGAT
ncbi:hypothetical protein D9M73_188420 [compost metagenome]